MGTEAIKAIIEKSRDIDRVAVKIYGDFASRTENGALATFWKEMAQEETEHVHCWDTMLGLADQLPAAEAIFDDPARVLRGLRDIHAKAEDLLRDSDPSDPASQFNVAFRLEFYLTQPALLILFRAWGDRFGERAIEQEYAQHLDRFIDAVQRFGIGSPEMTLVGEMTRRLWRENVRLVDQLARIRTLQGLIPICSHCKRIRDDSGYWRQLEAYLSEHTDASFSHGICPQCEREHYPHD